MGLEVECDQFGERDYALFQERLQENLCALGELLRRPDFGLGAKTIGAELECSLVDGSGRPLPLNTDVLALASHPNVALEVDRFNLEYNSRPVPLTGTSFGALARDLDEGLESIRRAALAHGGRVVVIGILPTLSLQDLGPMALSDERRFRALSAATRRLRHASFRVAIEGEEALSTTCDDVTLEGANTSFQIHLRVPPAEFASMFNAAQIAAAPALAGSANSPTFLGRRLWEETRIAVFEQAVDTRAPEESWRAPRVCFGHGWVRESAYELFAENVALHPPLLPVVGSEDSLACVRSGDIPELRELRLHHGTVWQWNRAVYDPGCGGHLRIELRALPSGPTVADMMANGAFLLGLTLGLAPLASKLMPALPFRHAQENFYLAARFGLEATLLWPSESAPSPRPVRARDLIPRLVPLAHQALLDHGVDAAECDRLLALFAARCTSGLTGSRWQTRVLAELEQELPRKEALAAMLERYLACAAVGSPVHCWPV